MVPNTCFRININDESQLKKAVGYLVKAGIKNVLITLGKKGSYFYNNQGECIFTESYNVDAVDTTADGDTFIVAFAVAVQ